MRIPQVLVTHVPMRSMLLAVGILLTPRVVFGGCTPATYGQLRQYLDARGRESEVVFFATWCRACASHVQKAGQDTVLVAAFDDVARVDAFRRQSKTGLVCFIDRGITDVLGVRSVPARFTYMHGRWRRLK